MGKNKVGMILIIALLVALLILFGVGFFLLYSTVKKGNTKEEVQPIVKEEKIDRNDITIFPIGAESIVTNLLEGPDGKKHIIKIKVNLGIHSGKKQKKESDKLVKTLESQIVFLQDTVLGICRNKTFEELKRNNAQAILADEIQLKLSEAFDTDLINEVIINELILD